jgi:hypothetical protein
MTGGSTDLDALLVSQGGFGPAYEKLTAIAASALSRYAGNFGARVALRQIQPFDLVDVAFERLLVRMAEGPIDPGMDVFDLLCSYINNKARALAKSAKEGRLLRIEGEEEGKMAYDGFADDATLDPADQLLVVEDGEYVGKVLAQVIAGAKGDVEVVSLCEAIIEGNFTDYDDIRSWACLDQAQFDAARKRLKRQVSIALKSVDEGKKQ